MVVFSDLSIGEMLAVFGCLWFMMTPVQEPVNMQYAWYAANAALGRINALPGLASEPQHPALRDPFAGRATIGIALDPVSFAYDEGETVLDDVSLMVAPGEKVALVGASGGGKSTLVQALLGLYPVKSGRVRCPESSCTRMYIPVPALRAHPADARLLRFLAVP